MQNEQLMAFVMSAGRARNSSEAEQCHKQSGTNPFGYHALSPSVGLHIFVGYFYLISRIILSLLHRRCRPPVGTNARVIGYFNHANLRQPQY
jgi:hypothetical protein